MDIENAKNWASQPDVCRCCLSTSGIWDLTASYISKAGVKEVFSDMLQECFGLTLSFLAEWGPSRLICSLCIEHLREATSFRKQVFEAEYHFKEVYQGKKIAYENQRNICIKYEHFNENDDLECNNGSPVDSNHEQELESENTGKPINDEQNSTTNRKCRKKTVLKIKKSKRKVKSNNEEYDSDTPISKLSKNLKLAEDVIKEKDDDVNSCSKKFDKDILKSKTGTIDRLVVPKLKNGVKQLSERKRVIVTSGIVLKYTNACPFRHQKSWFQCFYCLEEFMELNTLRSHTLEIHKNIDQELKKMKRYPRSLQIDITLLKCLHCMKELSTVESMRKHFLEVHKKTIYNECIADYKVDTSPYKCHICEREFHVFRSLTTHLNEHYANCICDVCGKSFINTKRLKVHKRTHEDGHYPCNECGKVLKTKTSKANHMESAHSKRILKCHICSEPMKHYNDRIKHMSEIHNITHKFKCPICGREYNIKHYLATHMRQTHGLKNKKCPECGMAFITNHVLKKHMLKHTGEKPFTCEVCSKSYARNYTLREHMRSHDNDRRFLCPV